MVIRLELARLTVEFEFPKGDALPGLVWEGHPNRTSPGPEVYHLDFVSRKGKKISL
jgi:hypothetical protein